ncbi:hypothetical protein FH972_026285 [Carpinus fangiana]|uniref:DASH complex subunit DAD2 n=1 Tax=Carpinus fangiana TaxID=176857 RepID=A0A5N6L3K9_9ROSI|nr:hypothetical protein FH972_026285 [Carpinus fangiana]
MSRPTLPAHFRASSLAANPSASTYQPGHSAHPSLGGSGAYGSSSQQQASPALLARIAEKKTELANLRELRDSSAQLATHMASLEAKLATLSDGTAAVACVLGNWGSVLQAISLASCTWHLRRLVLLLLLIDMCVQPRFHSQRRSTTKTRRKTMNCQMEESLCPRHLFAYLFSRPTRLHVLLPPPLPPKIRLTERCWLTNMAQLIDDLETNAVPRGFIQEDFAHPHDIYNHLQPQSSNAQGTQPTLQNLPEPH